MTIEATPSAQAVDGSSALETIRPPSQPSALVTHRARRVAGRTNEPAQTIQVSTTRALDTVADEVRRLLVNAEAILVVARYEVGRLISQYADELKMSEHQAILAFAPRVDEDDGVLYDAIRIFKVFPRRSDFEVIAKRVNKKGRPLTYSHFVELSKVEQDLRRNSLIQQALAFSWTVAQLRDHVNPKPTEAVEVPKLPDPQPVQTVAKVDPASPVLEAEVDENPEVEAAPTAPEARRGVTRLATYAREFTQNAEEFLDRVTDAGLGVCFRNMNDEQRRTLELDLLALENAETCLRAIRAKLVQASAGFQTSESVLSETKDE